MWLGVGHLRALTVRAATSRACVRFPSSALPRGGCLALPSENARSQTAVARQRTEHITGRMQRHSRGAGGFVETALLRRHEGDSPPLRIAVPQPSMVGGASPRLTGIAAPRGYGRTVTCMSESDSAGSTWNQADRVGIAVTVALSGVMLWACVAALVGISRGNTRVAVAVLQGVPPATLAVAVGVLILPTLTAGCAAVLWLLIWSNAKTAPKGQWAFALACTAVALPLTPALILLALAALVLALRSLLWLSSRSQRGQREISRFWCISATGCLLMLTLTARTSFSSDDLLPMQTLQYLPAGASAPVGVSGQLLSDDGQKVLMLTRGGRLETLAETGILDRQTCSRDHAAMGLFGDLMRPPAAALRPPVRAASRCLSSDPPTARLHPGLAVTPAPA